MPQAERNEILTFIESNMVKVLVSLLQREKKLVNFDPALTTEKSIEVLLESAEGATSGAIAQHLVGAKLQLRWPHIPIPNDSASTADAPTSRPGDFLINQGVVHVTMSPQDAVFAKCRSNLNQGYSVYLLVPNKRLSLAITKAKRLGIADNISIKSIESFIAQNIDEIAEFSKEELSRQREELLRIYNKRVKEAHERHAPFLVLKEGALFEIRQEDENEPTKLGVNDQQTNISPTSSSADFYVAESLFPLKEEETDHDN